MLFTLKVNTTMTNFIIKKLPYDLSSHAGLAFFGKYLKAANLKSYIALLSLGKNEPLSRPECQTHLVLASPGTPLFPASIA